MTSTSSRRWRKPRAMSRGSTRRRPSTSANVAPMRPQMAPEAPTLYEGSPPMATRSPPATAVAMPPPTADAQYTAR